MSIGPKVTTPSGSRGPEGVAQLRAPHQWARQIALKPIVYISPEETSAVKLTPATFSPLIV
jgi:hypothetical protein